jgi:dTDP-4-amino-4,6-dideoxygalactose transaminase
MSQVSHSWAVPFNRPSVPPFEAIADDIRDAFATGSLTKGPRLAAFERDAERVIGTAHVVGVSSCTSGLMLVLRAIADDVAGDDPHNGNRRQVILPSFNFLAAPAAVVWAGLEPVFVEVDPTTFTLDPAAVEQAISGRTAAILGCHTFGCPCDAERLAKIAAAAGVPLVIDAAHGLGSEVDGHQVGREGFAQVFSLSPTKLVVAGEGGLVATDCPRLAAAITTGREYGNDGAYGCQHAGLNARLPEISAMLGRASLAHLPATVAGRRAAAAAYREGLADLPGISLQRIPSSYASSWKDFCIAVCEPEAGISRDALRHQLAEAGIDTRAYYSPACHQMEAFARFATAGALPITERLASTLLALPMGAHVTPAMAVHVSGEIRRIVAEAREAVSA